MTDSPKTPGPHSVLNGALVLGQVVTTRAVHDHHLVAAQEALRKFERMDFGKQCPEDQEVNRQALQENSRLLGVYPSGDVTLWVIRDAVSPEGEWDTVTTVLLPEEY